MNIIYQKVNSQKYNIITKNGKLLGELLMDVDGYFYFWPEDNNGAWAANHLRDVADRLDEVNKDWNNQIIKELSKS